MPKFEELVILCETYKPGFVCIVESWSPLSNDIENLELIIPNYQVLRLDRNRHGGGILVFIHNSLTHSVISKSTSNLELMLISVGHANLTNKLCVGIFLSPTKFFLYMYGCFFIIVLESVDVSLLSNFIFVGDFNFYNTYHPLFHKLDDIISTFSLTLVVKDPTHVNQIGADTLLDLVLVCSRNHVESLKSL